MRKLAPRIIIVWIVLLECSNLRKVAEALNIGIPYLRARYGIARRGTVLYEVAKERNSISESKKQAEEWETSEEREEPSNIVIVEDEVPSKKKMIDPDAVWLVSRAASAGVTTGFGVSLFKLSISQIRDLTYGSSLSENMPVFLIPALGGLAVSLLTLIGKEKFPPGLAGIVKEIDKDANWGEGRQGNQIIKRKIKNLLKFCRKAAASVFTLGTGASLGPEGPAVEVGIAASRLFMDPTAKPAMSRLGAIQEQRLLLSCGAAAGVSSGFNAPIAGVFFALEIVQAALPLPTGSVQQPPPLSSKISITAILLASVLSALVTRQTLGSELALDVSNHYSVESPIYELPLYLLLGACSGFVASVFNAASKFSKDSFDGNGPEWTRTTVARIPKSYRPIVGGLICGLVSIAFPQILFFGYETLNSLIQNVSLPVSLLLSLLVVKIFTTAVSAGSGLVGGTFAPALFMGAMVGASFHDIVTHIIQSNFVLFELADEHSYTIVGAASALAALFRAPLTATLLLFELTRDYEVLLPLMASAGVGVLVGDILDDKFQNILEGSKDQDLILMVDANDVEGKENQ